MRPIIGVENRSAQEVFYIMCDRITSALRSAAPMPRVKVLEWFPVEAICTREKAQALGGHYSVVEFDKDRPDRHFATNIDLGGLAFVFLLEPDMEFGGTRPKRFSTIEAAKAAAQADYEARILSALTAPPAREIRGRIYGGGGGGGAGVLQLNQHGGGGGGAGIPGAWHFPFETGVRGGSGGGPGALRSATPMPEPVAWIDPARLAMLDPTATDGGITATALVWSSQDLTGELVPLYPTPPAREISEAEVERAARALAADELGMGDPPAVVATIVEHQWKAFAKQARAALEAARSPS
jgi:hypothetical protein